MKKTLLVTMLLLSCVLLGVSGALAGEILDGILKRGELVVGISGDQIPFNATTKDCEIVGLDADIARGIAKGMNVKIRFSRMPFAELLPALQSGKVDMIVSGMTMTPERNTKVAFIGPYYVSGKGIPAAKFLICHRRKNRPQVSPQICEKRCRHRYRCSSFFDYLQPPLFAESDVQTAEPFRKQRKGRKTAAEETNPVELFPDFTARRLL